MTGTARGKEEEDYYCITSSVLCNINNEFISDKGPYVHIKHTTGTIIYM